MKKETLIKTMAEVAMFSALGFVLDLLAGVYSKALFVNGGSIGIAMMCVFFMSYRRGLIPGLATGLIIGLLQLAGGWYTSPLADEGWKAFIQIGLDYWLAYPLTGFAGVMFRAFQKGDSQKKRIWALVIGCTIGGFLKYLCHFLSGVIFWPDDLWGVGGSVAYSLLYNGAYMIPSIILSTGLLIVLYLRVPALFNDPNEYHLGRAKTASVSPSGEGMSDSNSQGTNSEGK
jgi:thiamine transporter